MTGEPAATVLFLCTGNYYRSRFAELLFNARAAASGLRHRATSAGLAPQCWTRNPGPISPYTLAALATRGIAPPDPSRIPQDVTEAALEDAALVVALKEAEHRPILRERFPRFVDRVRYWRVDDIDVAPPVVAIAAIEALVEALVRELDVPPAADDPDGRSRSGL
jgi:protein-tyrosine phosphatase